MSDNLNLPPFYVGQRVVCIDSFFEDMEGEIAPTKDEVYTIRFIEYEFGDWYVMLKEIINEQRFYEENNEISECTFIASKFRPIHENFQHIEYKEALEQEKALISSN